MSRVRKTAGPAAQMWSAMSPLPREFFARDPRLVARELLGKFLVRRRGRGARAGLLAGKIVEAEAYLGADDAAAHAFRGKTPRNSVLFGPPGHAYVYFTYGMHFCMNISCQPEGEAGCVLLRALEPVAGIRAMAANRSIEIDGPPDARRLRALTAGPARLCQALGITRERDNGKDVCSLDSDLLAMAGGPGVAADLIVTTERIGISRATELPLRFLLKGNPFISR